ncbi:MAG: lysozyme, partial [Bacilli bacterium]
MIITKSGIDLIKKYEGCSLTAYYCPSGVLTIGWGHTKNVYDGMTITQERADQLFMEDIKRYYPKGNWSQNEFNALTSFGYNCGVGAMQNVIDSGDITGQMYLYVNGNFGYLEGLAKRRKEEIELFNTPVQDNISTSNSYYEKGIAKVICDRLNIRNLPSLQGEIQKEYYIKGEEIKPYYKVHICDGYYWV